MELVSYLISYNFVSVALIIGIIVLLIENRKERPRGTEHIAVIVLLLTIIVANTFFRELFLKESYDANYDYRGDPAMYFMYFRSTVEHILFPMIADTARYAKRKKVSAFHSRGHTYTGGNNQPFRSEDNFQL